MQYFSSRNDKERISFKQAIINGISSDGGLYLPESFPQVDLKSLQGLSYQNLAYKILKAYLTDFTESELKDCISKAYDDKFPEEVLSLHKCKDRYFLELYHGPTLAFKDFALSILPRFMEKAGDDLKLKDKLLILTATSGDTGSASLEGFTDMKGIDIVVFFPNDGISPIQRLQMCTNKGENTGVFAIRGNFDQAQTGVKRIFTDRDLVRKLKEKHVSFSSANSINIGRLLPQVVYYFSAYNKLIEKDEIRLGEEVSFCVPTGNFGDILAGFYAKKMGLPIKKLLVASNENKVLTDFFKSGIYDKRRELKLTSSPSMDILVSSNLERLLYEKSKDPDLVKKLEADLNMKGTFKTDLDFSEFFADYCSEDNTLKEIKRIYNENSYLIDTHTAVGSFVASSYMKKTGAKEKVIILSTASPYKFPEAVMKSLNLKSSGNLFRDLEKIEAYTKAPLPLNLKNLENKQIINKKIIEPDSMEDTLREFIRNRK